MAEAGRAALPEVAIHDRPVHEDAERRRVPEDVVGQLLHQRDDELAARDPLAAGGVLEG